MREKVLALAERWATVGGLARDVLSARGGNVVMASEEAAAPPPPPRPQSSVLWQPPQAEAQRSMPTSSAAPAPVVAAPTQSERRARAAAAAESRAKGGSSSIIAETAPVAPKLPQPVVARMDALIHVVHCVFVGHGYTSEEKQECCGHYRLLYAHDHKPPIRVTYVPLQRHLVTYAASMQFDNPLKATVQVGMPAAAVQAKIDYLLLYPLLYRQCVPMLTATPPEALFGFICCLSIPALSAVSSTCRSLSSSIMDDDIVWLRVVLSLPQSQHIQQELDALRKRESNGEAIPRGAYRNLVRTEVQRARREAETAQRRRQEALAERGRLREGLLQPRRPQMPGGGFPFVIGGPHDLEPPGFRPPPNPFRGGGGGFGGGFGPRFH